MLDHSLQAAYPEELFLSPSRSASEVLRLETRRLQSATYVVTIALQCTSVLP